MTKVKRFNSYTLEIRMDEFKTMEVPESGANPVQLCAKLISTGCSRKGELHTSFSRFAPGLPLMKLRIVPCSIHSDISARPNRVSLIPRKGTRFGWKNRFQTTASRQNICHRFVRPSNSEKQQRGQPHLHWFISLILILLEDLHRLDGDALSIVSCLPNVSIATPGIGLRPFKFDSIFYQKRRGPLPIYLTHPLENDERFLLFFLLQFRSGRL
jgi:hypothetical protein